MFSSLASFLPSLPLNISHNHHPSNLPPFNPNDTAEEEAAEREPIDEPEDVGQKKTSGKAKSPNETFIFVRPPPAKSNHPLNLQVQLVPPATHARQPSLDEPPDTANTLTRTASNRSDASGYSSTVSFASTSSTSQGRRTIIPLYSLQAHNVMANVIVDAGTDAKIAKLQRRGMEFIDLAVLEPVEVWAEKPRAIKTSRPATPDPTFITTTSSTASLSSGSLAQHTPTVMSAQSPQQQSYTQRQPPPQLSIPVPLNKRQGGEPTKRNIFGKIFKKGKDATPPVSPAPSATFSIKTPTLHTPDPDATPTPGRTGGRGHTRNLSVTLSPTSPRNRSPSPNPLAKMGLQVPGMEEANASTSDLSVTGGSDEKILRPPVLGIQPTLSYSYVPSTAGATPGLIPSFQMSKSPRALMYVWFVKKWLKRRADSQDTGGLLGVMQMQASRRASSILSGSSTTSLGPLEEGVEVRFEWKRASSKGKTRGKGKERRGAAEAPEPRERVKENAASRRFSTLSQRSVSTNFSMSEDGGGKSRPGTPTRVREQERKGSFSSPNRDLDADEDSDPEDSETPWVCTLKIRRTGSGAGARGEHDYASTNGSARRTRGLSGTEPSHHEELGVLPPSPGSQVLRIKVGTLSPTPHHPKVVGMLKVPFPLPDVEVERMGISRRPLGYTNARPLPSQWGGTTLTAEEIKDVVCSTGLWLVVREGFGGIGRVSRKGDGWRIRA